MSFVGAGCELIKDSGLDGLWLLSMPKMMEGKIYTKTLRACLLTDAALNISLLQAAKCPISSDLPSHSPSAPQETEQMYVQEKRTVWQ